MIRLPRPPAVEVDTRRLIPHAVVLTPDQAVRALAEFARRGVSFQTVAASPPPTRTKPKKGTTR